VKTTRKEGVLALYKGITPTLTRQIVLNIVRFVAFEKIRDILTAANDDA
jgi:hypothetical protein